MTLLLDIGKVALVAGPLVAFIGWYAWTTYMEATGRGYFS